MRENGECIRCTTPKREATFLLSFDTAAAARGEGAAPRVETLDLSQGADVADGVTVGTTLGGGGSAVTDIAVSRDGGQLAVAHSDGTVKVRQAVQA